MRTATISIVILAALSVSCARVEAPPAAQPLEKQRTAVDDRLKAIDKAKAVQDAVDQQKKDTDKKIEDAGG